ncbi:nucleoside/nucleotide kinase family protein [Cellulomonas xiejunii]|uniref:Nucleoside/nucleotide kinase family protein n=1 Tax=Cellulomonas xiejunii TaxID=2968083 RepID=A0ABY5KJT5_9CELL|nr:nucleoside/nucleotide kinase family protein [Cellulomonas xiejunii]MCC2320445.1 nucleoside/nucleotide kinase family protein [Cellulomonas xiejunii]UUI70741.1 nucleoside/nucleotide kinase family protein [Cellulomonas xiejunii]
MSGRPTEPVPTPPHVLPEAPLDPALADRVRTLLADGRRRLLGIAGAPGAGKSTLAAQVAAAFREACVVVPMDGFHLAQSELERIGRADRKGAPDTFDADGYVALLRRLREPRPGHVVYAPEYRRDLRNPVAGAVAVPSDVPLVVTEGNYLLLDEHGFGPVADLLDETWFVAPDDDVRLARLVARHEQFGKPPAAALAWSTGPDAANARLVAPTARRADVVVGPGLPG